MPEAAATAGGQLHIEDFSDALAAVTGWDRCLAALEDQRPVAIDSVWGSSCALVAAAIVDQTRRPIVALFPTERDAARFADDWPVFSTRPVELFPTIDSGSTDDLTADPRYGQRLRVLKKLGAQKAGVVNEVPTAPTAYSLPGDTQTLTIATSIQALSHPVPLPAALDAAALELGAGQQRDLDEVRNWLARAGFQQVPAVRIPGEYSVRGGIVDIFAPDWTTPARIEWFDRDIESIRFFDVETQRSSGRCSGIRIEGSATFDVGEKGHLMAWISGVATVLMFEPQEIASRSSMLLARQTDASKLHSLSDIQASFRRHAVALAGRLIAETDVPFCRLPISPVEKFSGEITEVRREIDQVAGNAHVFLLANNESEIHRVREILAPTRTANEGRLHFRTGGLHAGFHFDHVGAVVLGCDQLFNRRDLRRKAVRKNARPIDNFIDLQPGDLIVHLAHGIGRFRGLKVLDKDRQRTEHLELEFHGGTRIYLPASKIGLVQKYVGGTKHRPRLAKIGGKSWQKQKQAAAEAVTDMAAEMLEIQARRTTRPGIPLAADTAWQFEFEHSFPFHETPDQITAIDDIKSDMESDRPMDRLLCGDVGYGKTEVAMRAAFKAVENGYQVAVLVPTTVLAEQHFRTFRERMAEYPVDIAKLSRFCTSAEQRETLEGLVSGKIDIVIGTHRLASKDVRLRNPGLIIIDEEQKFGVHHKERLKSMRAEIDVLTMSATPIPRTLHMSLVGVRDISNLETPPEDRLAVQTRVSSFDERLIREAVLRELERGGQVYFVHNRVLDIELVRDRLRHIVPEAKIGVGHGQMRDGQLERVMSQFVKGRFDVLLATTIVENGLDIPNANTIFIDEANRYGLSDLHQLRGRVGRYKHRAYCYLLIDPRKHMNPNAAKRLHAIEKYSEMGAGFAIAMRDLEIRGAGNLLGTEQSGHIASVGYELYCQLLETAVRNLKRLPAPVSVDVDVDLPVEAYLPDDYVPDKKSKIDLYRRLSRAETFDQVKLLKQELRDRYGKLPPAVIRLLKLAEVRLEATLWQIHQIFLDDKYLGFRFHDAARMRQLAGECRFPLRIVDDSTAYLTLKSTLTAPDQLIALLNSILRREGGIA